MKLAIYMPNWIGDAVMATASLRAIRDHLPTAEIVGIMRPSIADVLAGTSLVDRELLYHPRGSNPLHKGWPFLRTLRDERFDTALLLTNSVRTAWLAWMSGASRRIGFARDLRSWLLTDRVTPRSRQVPNPVIDEYRRLAEQLGCSKSLRRIELAVREKDQAELEQFWQTQSGGDQQPTGGYVCLNTGGAFGKAKNWPRESFAELARRIAVEFDKSVLVVCGPAEKDDARWIAAEADHAKVLSLADTPVSIGLTKAAIRSADLLVTTDSGPRHFAAAFDTPVITLFGPTHIAWSETYYDRAEHMQVKVECGPCQKRECPLGHHRCMKELSVDLVFSAVRRQLDYRIVRRHVA